MLSAKPSATPEQIFNALTSTAYNPNTSGSDSSLGHGVIDAVAAVDAILNGINNDDGGNGNDGIANPTTPPPTVGSDSGGNDSDCVQLEITVQTDRYGSDISHWLQSDGGEFLFYQDNLDSFRIYKAQGCISLFQW
jgi:hypothetical protein